MSRREGGGGLRITRYIQARANSARDNHHGLSDPSCSSKLGRMQCRYAALRTTVSLGRAEGVRAGSLPSPQIRQPLKKQAGSGPRLSPYRAEGGTNLSAAEGQIYRLNLVDSPFHNKYLANLPPALQCMNSTSLTITVNERS